MNKLAASIFALVLASATGLSTASQAYATYTDDDGEDRSVIVYNLSDNLIRNIQLSNVHDGIWYPARVLEAGDYGNQMLIAPRNPQGYCRFNALITYNDGTQVTVNDINVCTVGTLDVGEDGTSYVS